MEAHVIDVRDTAARPGSSVAMAAGTTRDAVVAMLAGLGHPVVITSDRGEALLSAIEARTDPLVVVELSRLGEAGLSGLSRTARAVPNSAVVLLLPLGLSSADVPARGLAAVVDEVDVAGLRRLATAVLAPSPDLRGQVS